MIEFEKLNRLVAKDTSKQSRKLYIKTLVSLEDLQNEAYEREKAAKKKMNATNNRALNTFRQRIRKNNREHEDEIKKYRDDPTSFDTESEEETRPEEREVRDEMLGPDGQVLRGFIAPEDDDDEGFATVGRGGRAMVYTTDGIFKHLKMISEARGKKSTDKGEQIKILEKLRDVAQTPYQKTRVYLNLIGSRFEYVAPAQPMPVEQWNSYLLSFDGADFSAQAELTALLEVLESNPSYVIDENADEISLDDPPPDPKPGEIVKIKGSLATWIDRLDEELNKSLQNIDPHTTEYIERLRDEQSLYVVIVRGGILFERAQKEGYNTNGSLSRIVLLRLEHIYYKVAQQPLICANECSLHLSLRVWKRSPGNGFPRIWIRSSHLAQLQPSIWFKFSVYTSTNMANPKIVFERYYSISTISPSKINSIELGTCS